MGRAWRKFKSLTSSAMGDIEKYYNQKFIDKQSWQMIVWRDGCNKENPFETFILTRLHYGLSCAATMSRIGLDLITSYGESNCTSFNGKYTVNKPSSNSNIHCPDTPHIFKTISDFF